MPEKNTDNWLLIGMFIVATLASLGNALAEEDGLTHTRKILNYQRLII
jgi:hypothetical protein